jgi:multidrug efflux system outer membrane protein
MTHHRIFSLSLACVLLSFLLSACAVGPDYAPPEVEAPDEFEYAAEGPEAPVVENWWELFEDETLNRLIAEAETGNFDLTAALQRVRQARAAARVERAGVFPTLSADPFLERGKDSQTLNPQAESSPSTAYGVPFNVGYEADLFGRVRRGFEAARADAQAAEESYRSFQLVLQTDVANTYFLLRGLDLEIAVVERAQAVREEQLKILGSRYEFGIISRLPLSQAEAELNATRATLHALRRDRAQLENALAVLLGKAPSEFNLPPTPLEDDPPPVPSVVPSALLTARPDLRAAERTMAAANARVGVATADFFPRITIGADVGYAADQPDTLFNSRSFTWGVLPNIHIPIFEGGRLNANLERARARYAEVYASYRQAVIRAFGEAEDALVSVDMLARQANSNQMAVRAAEQAFEISKRQFEGGLVNYLSVLDSERTYLDNLRLSSVILAQQYTSAVNLVKAIGGSW